MSMNATPYVRALSQLGFDLDSTEWISLLPGNWDPSIDTRVNIKPAGAMTWRNIAQLKVSPFGLALQGRAKNFIQSNMDYVEYAWDEVGTVKQSRYPWPGMFGLDTNVASFTLNTELGTRFYAFATLLIGFASHVIASEPCSDAVQIDNEIVLSLGMQDFLVDGYFSFGNSPGKFLHSLFSGKPG